MALSLEAEAILFNGRNPAAVWQDARLSASLADQYRLYVEMTDRISARRQSANAFFLSLNAAIISLGGYTAVKEGAAVPDALIWLTVGAGILISLLWLRLILSYRDLNTARFSVIHSMERALAVRPYDAEWEAVGRGKKGWLYMPFTHIELWVPIAFAVIHLVGATVVSSTW